MFIAAFRIPKQIDVKENDTFFWDQASKQVIIRKTSGNYSVVSGETKYNDKSKEFIAIHEKSYLCSDQSQVYFYPGVNCTRSGKNLGMSVSSAQPYVNPCVLIGISGHPHVKNIGNDLTKPLSIHNEKNTFDLIACLGDILVYAEVNSFNLVIRHVSLTHVSATGCLLDEKIDGCVRILGYSNQLAGYLTPNHIYLIKDMNLLRMSHNTWLQPDSYWKSFHPIISASQDGEGSCVGVITKTRLYVFDLGQKTRCEVTFQDCTENTSIVPILGMGGFIINYRDALRKKLCYRVVHKLSSESWVELDRGDGTVFFDPNTGMYFHVRQILGGQTDLLLDCVDADYFKPQWGRRSQV